METFEIRYRVAHDEHLVFDGKAWFILWQGTRLNLEEEEALAMALPSIDRAHTVADLLVRIALSKAIFVRLPFTGTSQVPPHVYQGSVFARHLRLKALSVGIGVMEPVRILLSGLVEQPAWLGAEYQVQQPDGSAMGLADWIGREFA